MNLDLWKKRKKELGLTIEDIAKKADLQKGSVQNIFAGYVPNPRIDTVEAIEKALGIDKTWTAEDYESGVTDKKRVWITADEETWLNYYKELRNVSEQDYDTVCLLIETLIKNKK